MKKLSHYIKEADVARRAIGHFNISDSTALKAIAEISAELSVPIIVGTAEGEAAFGGRDEAAALISMLREKKKLLLFLNSDHTHSLAEVKKAVAAGYDAILFDASKLPFEENIKATREVVRFVKSKKKDIIVEGEIGYIGSSSAVFEKLPEGAAQKSSELTSPEEAARFIKETGVDMLAPAVGNVHGMFAHGPDPHLDIERIRAITKRVKIPLVLHGASGNTEADLRMAIKAGMAIVHINTELRVAWRSGLDEAFRAHPVETTPYKLLMAPLHKMKEVVYNHCRLFSHP